MSGVRTRLLQASGASGLSLIARLLEQFLLVPVLLTAWSVELFGEWLLIAAIPIYLSLLDFGVVQSGSNELAKRAGDNDDDGVRRFFRDYTSFFLIWSIILFAILSALVASSPVADWLSLERIGQTDAQIIFVLLIAGTLLSHNALALIGGMRAKKIFPAGLTTRALGAFLRVGLAFVAVALLDYGPIALAAILLGTRILEYAILALILAGRGLTVPINPFRKRQEKLRQFVTSGLEFLLFPLAQSLILQGAIVVIGFTLGAAAVAIFATHRTLSRATSQAVQLVVIPLRAESGLLQDEASRPELAAILLSASRLTFWAALACAALLLLFGAPIFALWTSGKIAFMPALFAGLILATILEAVWTVASSIRLGSNRHRPLAWSYLAVSVLAFALMVLFAANLGLTAIPLALIIGEVLMVAITIPLTVAVLDLRSRDYIAALLTFPAKEIGVLANHLAGRRG